MSGECDKCGEHPVDCMCALKEKIIKVAPKPKKDIILYIAVVVNALFMIGTLIWIALS